MTQGTTGTLPHAGPTATVASVSGGPTTFSRGGQPGASADVTGGSPTGAPSRAAIGGGFGGGFGGDTASGALISYLEAHQGSAKYLVATVSANQAAPIIPSTGRAVMALGGFSGSDHILTVAQLQTPVREGQLRYFLLGGGGGQSALENWIISNCQAVSSSAAGTSSLYVCSA